MRLYQSVCWSTQLEERSRAEESWGGRTCNLRARQGGAGGVEGQGVHEKARSPTQLTLKAQSDETRAVDGKKAASRARAAGNACGVPVQVTESVRVPSARLALGAHVTEPPPAPSL